LSFPERIYTKEEVQVAKELVEKGYKHRLRVKGSRDFKKKARQALQLVKTAGYHDFLRSYIRCIVEIDGLTQLRESEAAIWANTYALQSSVDAASLFVQKAHHMKEYLDGKLYYGGEAEKRSVGKRIEFIKKLQAKTRKKEIKNECERLLDLWKESSLVY